MRLKSQFVIAIISSLLLFLFSGCGPSLPTSAGSSAGGSGAASIPTSTVASATAGNTQNTITWSAVTGATSYNIYWTNNPAASTTVRASGSKMFAPPNITSPYTHIGLTNSSTYYYVVTAVNNVGESNPSNTVAATPLVSIPLPTPTNLTASATSTTTATQIDINWTAAGGATSYNIYSSTLPNPAITTANLVTATASTSFSHTVLTTNTTYYYKVTAIINASESNSSNTASATTPPFIPTGLTATASGARQINLSWSPAVGATSYNIYYSTTSNPVTKSNGTLIPNVVGTSFNHTGLTPGMTYYYSVAAIGSPNTNLSDNSATANATTVPLGVSWTAVGIPYNILNSVTYGNSGFVAVGNTGIIYTSPDGITWTSRTSGTTANLSKVIYGSQGYVAVSYGTPLIIKSTDGITWSQVTLPVTSAPIASLTGLNYYGGRYYLLGILQSLTLTYNRSPAATLLNTALIMDTSNLTQWNVNDRRYIQNTTGVYNDYTIPDMTDIYQDIVCGPWGNTGKILPPNIVGFELRCYLDIIGSYTQQIGTTFTWTESFVRIIPIQSGYGMISNNTGARFFRGDGVNWNPVIPISTFITAKDITNTTSLRNLVVVGSGTSAILSSEDDGVTWTDRTPIGANSLNSVTYGANTIVAVGPGSTIWVSQ